MKLLRVAEFRLVGSLVVSGTLPSPGVRWLQILDLSGGGSQGQGQRLSAAALRERSQAKAAAWGQGGKTTFSLPTGIHDANDMSTLNVMELKRQFNSQVRWSTVPSCATICLVFVALRWHSHACNARSYVQCVRSARGVVHGSRD